MAEGRFDEGSGMWTPSAPSSFRGAQASLLGGPATVSMKSEMGSLLRDLEGVEKAVSSLTKQVEKLADAWKSVGKAAGGTGTPSGGTISTPSFSGGGGPGPLNLDFTRTSTAQSPYPGRGESQNTISKPSMANSEIIYGGAAAGAQALGLRVNNLMGSTAQPAVLANYMAQQMSLLQGRRPTSSSGVQNFNTIARASFAWNNPQDLASAFQTVMTQMGPQSPGQMQTALRNVSQGALLAPQLGAGGSASALASFYNSAPLTNKLFGTGLRGAGGRVNDLSGSLQHLIAYALTGSPGGQVNWRQGTRLASRFAGNSQAAQQLEALGASPDLVQMLQQYLMYSGAAGRPMNLNQSPDQLAKQYGIGTGLSRSYQQTAQALGLQQTQTGLAGQEGARAVNSFTQALHNLIGGAVAGPGGSTLSDLGIVLGKIVSSGTELVSVWAELRLLSALGGAGGGKGIGGLFGKGAAAGAEGAGSMGLLSRLKGMPGWAKGGLGIMAAQGGGQLIQGIGANAQTGQRNKVASTVGGALKWGGTGLALGAMVPGLDLTGIPEAVGGIAGLVGGGIAGLFGVGDSSQMRGLGDGALAGPGHTGHMSGSLTAALARMFAANPRLRLMSGYRTAQDQMVLASQHPDMAAEPGKSLHEHGLAADLGPPSEYGWIAANARRFGLYNPLPSKEPWHVQPLSTSTNAQTTTMGTLTAGNLTASMTPMQMLNLSFGMGGGGSRSGGTVTAATGGGGGGSTGGPGVAGGGGASPPMPSNTNAAANKRLMQQMAAAYGWGSGPQWDALNAVTMDESGYIVNARSGESPGPPNNRAYGIPQALPPGKMASAGADWVTNPATQIKWMLQYIKGRWHTPEGALANENAARWYAAGSWDVPNTGPAVVHKGEMIIPSVPAEKIRQGATGSAAVGKGAGASISATFNIYVMQASQAEAERLAQMTLDALNRLQHNNLVGTS